MKRILSNFKPPKDNKAYGPSSQDSAKLVILVKKMFICYFLRLRSCKYYFHGYDKSSINKKLNIVKNIDWIKSFRIFLPIGNVVWANVLAAFTWCIFDSLSMSVELHFEFLHADSFSMHQIVVAFFCNEINLKTLKVVLCLQTFVIVISQASNFVLFNQ
jgi:hypothetical protein